MTFTDIPSGAAVFVDANCLVYAATADPTYGGNCSRLLEGIENNTLQGFSSAHIVGEVTHRLMTIEASLMFQRPMTGIANWLRRHPQEIKQLSQYRQSIADLLAIPIKVLATTAVNMAHSTALSGQYGLLTNDALVVATMLSHQLNHLASNDADFDRVPGISRYAPV